MNELRPPASWFSGTPIYIHLVGAGGTGSEMLDQLFRMDVSLRMLGHPGFKIDVFDQDYVSEWNLGRQRFWPVDVGKNKAKALVDRYIRGWPNTRMFGFNQFYDYTELNPGPFKESPNLVISCVDSGRWRWDFAQEAIANSDEVPNAEEILWLDLGNDRTTGQIILGHLHCPSGKPRLPNVADLYPSLEHSEDKDEDSCSAEQAIAKQDFGINSQMAVTGAGFIWQLIREGRLTSHGAFIDRQDFSCQALPISQNQWALFGYTG